MSGLHIAKCIKDERVELIGFFQNVFKFEPVDTY